jgi:hypothetical protein
VRKTGTRTQTLADSVHSKSCLHSGATSSFKLLDVRIAPRESRSRDFADSKVVANSSKTGRRTHDCTLIPAQRSLSKESLDKL